MTDQIDFTDKFASLLRQKLSWREAACPQILGYFLPNAFRIVVFMIDSMVCEERVFILFKKMNLKVVQKADKLPFRLYKGLRHFFEDFPIWVNYGSGSVRFTG